MARRTTEYHQCVMRKQRTATASAVIVSYLPARFAWPGSVVKRKQGDGTWDDGWIVESVGASRLENEVLDPHQAIKGHRRTTGDDLPRQP